MMGQVFRCAVCRTGTEASHSWVVKRMVLINSWSGKAEVVHVTSEVLKAMSSSNLERIHVG